MRVVEAGARPPVEHFGMSSATPHADVGRCARGARNSAAEQRMRSDQPRGRCCRHPVRGSDPRHRVAERSRTASRSLRARTAPGRRVGRPVSRPRRREPRARRRLRRDRACSARSRRRAPGAPGARCARGARRALGAAGSDGPGALDLRRAGHVAEDERVRRRAVHEPERDAGVERMRERALALDEEQPLPPAPRLRRRAARRRRR